MLKQPERESRNVNDLFYEMEGRQIQKMNKVLEGVELTKAEERTMIWLAGWEESTVDHLLSVIEKTARIRAEKRADTPINLSVSPRSNRIMLNKDKPSAIESEIHSSHKPMVCTLCISLCEAYAGYGNQFVNRCLCTYSQQSRREPRKEDAYRQTFIYQTKQAVRCGRKD